MVNIISKGALFVDVKMTAAHWAVLMFLYMLNSAASKHGQADRMGGIADCFQRVIRSACRTREVWI